ncbi:synaptonemal complex central element protein 1 isoform X1 [Xyrichtys novacula]|uniref:Synaptonemal complex central element protein 1 isoform X1 n=1 Tax=Xyrichtys novacula TaxID=13765 RepID=A0AAV1HFH7_XYRNO|nr:synaptonemal complex central element protein 1 isoform X1 [Xyrichtys novacula]
MSDSAGFNIDDLINAAAAIEGGEAQEVKVDQIMGKVRRLLQGKRALEEEIKAIQSLGDSLRKELETVQIEAYQLEENHKEKEELCRKLQFQCDESERDSARQIEQNKKRDELLEQYRCEIQEIELKQRKQRYLTFRKQHLNFKH